MILDNHIHNMLIVVVIKMILQVIVMGKNIHRYLNVI
jgi:hypothetical protein